MKLFLEADGPSVSWWLLIAGSVLYIGIALVMARVLSKKTPLVPEEAFALGVLWPFLAPYALVHRAVSGRWPNWR